MVSWSLDSEFIKAVHLALKRFRREKELGQHPLTALTVTEEIRHQHGWPSTPPGRAAALREALNTALKVLENRDKEQAELLWSRFWQGKSVIQMARQKGMVESTFYAYQEKAIRAFALALWELEQTARFRTQERQRYLKRNLPPPTYTLLFGVDEILARLRKALVSPEGPWLISIEGLGGLGKTALAHSLASWAAETGAFADIAWETARHPVFSTWDGIVEQDRASPALTLEMLLVTIATQLNRPDLLEKPPPRREASIRALLKSQPYLIVVDNLETAADCRALIPKLWESANPTRFLLTSCHSLRWHPQVFCFTLDELKEEDSFALMRHEGQMRGVLPLAEADEATLRQIYAVTGGNPLAIKLVVGQARHLPLERVLSNLRDAAGKQYEDLYRFIYRRSWELLSEDARKVLLAMPTLAPTGACWENLQAATRLDDARLDAAIRELVEMSLLNASGVSEKRYTIHRLTYTFIMTDLPGEW